MWTTSRSRCFRPVRLGLAALGLVLVATACSDDDGSTFQPTSELQAIHDATVAARSARYDGTITYGDGRPGATLDGVSAAEPARGEAETAGADGAPVTELIWADGAVYLRGQASFGTTATSPTPNGESDKWGTVPIETYGSALLALYDPFTLLERLQAVPLQAHLDGTESVDGQELDRFVIDTSANPMAVGLSERVELLTDDERRLAAVRLVGSLQSIEYRLSDYGTDVTVQAPPPEELARAAPTNTGEEPTGPYEKVAEGTFAAVPWQVVRAPATADGSCWRFDAPDGIDPVASTEDDGATCIAGADPAAPADERVQIVADAGADAPFDALVVVAPAGSEARLRFADRSAQDVLVDPAGFFVWVGPKEPLAVVLDITTPDGTRAACGPGSVSSLEDLESLPPDQIDQLDQAAWLCLPAD